MTDKNIKCIRKTKKVIYYLKNILIEYVNEQDIFDQISFEKENILSHAFYVIENGRYLHLRFKKITPILNKNYKNINLYTIKNFVSCQNRYASFQGNLNIK